MFLVSRKCLRQWFLHLFNQFLGLSCIFLTLANCLCSNSGNWGKQTYKFAFPVFLWALMNGLVMSSPNTRASSNEEHGTPDLLRTLHSVCSRAAHLWSLRILLINLDDFWQKVLCDELTVVHRMAKVGTLWSLKVPSNPFCGWKGPLRFICSKLYSTRPTQSRVPSPTSRWLLVISKEDALQLLCTISFIYRHLPAKYWDRQTGYMQHHIILG